MNSNNQGGGLRKLPFVSIAEEHFAPSTAARVDELAGDIINIAERRGVDPQEFAEELIADAQRHDPLAPCGRTPEQLRRLVRKAA